MKTITAKATFKPAAKSLFKDLESSRELASQILRSKDGKGNLKEFTVKGYVLRTNRPKSDSVKAKQSSAFSRFIIDLTK